MTPSLGSINLLEKLTEFTITYDYHFIKGYNKGYRWQVCRVKSGMVLSTRASVFLELGCITLPVHVCVTNLEALWTHTHDVYGGFLTWAGATVNSVSSPTPLLGKWEASWKLQASNGLVFAVTSPHPGATQEPTQTHLIRIKDAPVIQEITSVFRSICQEPGTKTKIYFSIISQCLMPDLFFGFFSTNVNRFPTILKVLWARFLRLASKVVLAII